MGHPVDLREGATTEHSQHDVGAMVATDESGREPSQLDGEAGNLALGVAEQDPIHHAPKTRNATIWVTARPGSPPQARRYPLNVGAAMIGGVTVVIGGGPPFANAVKLCEAYVIVPASTPSSA